VISFLSFRLFLCSILFRHLHANRFLQLVENIQRLARLGEVFSESDASTLTEAVRTKTRAYVLSFHRCECIYEFGWTHVCGCRILPANSRVLSRALEQLRAMFCGDQWEMAPCPAVCFAAIRVHRAVCGSKEMNDTLSLHCFSAV
jgi:hypothetical protein